MNESFQCDMGTNHGLNSEHLDTIRKQTNDNIGDKTQIKTNACFSVPKKKANGWKSKHERRNL